jgi:formylglycine-generating enzyme required for sulfatase activity
MKSREQGLCRGPIKNFSPRENPRVKILPNREKGVCSSFGRFQVCVLSLLLPSLITVVFADQPGSQADPPVGKWPELELVLIPAGSFLMGSPETEWGSRTDEQQHRVTIREPYYMTATEVSQRLWQAVMGHNPSYLYDCPDCPVENITWFDAVAFCNALSGHWGLALAYTVIDSTVRWDRRSPGFRLPTEAEWEYACRAGTQTVFNTGDCIATNLGNFHGYDPQQGCPAGLWRGQSLPVKSFPPNAWSLFEMHGNVAEWCWDWHQVFTVASSTDPEGPRQGIFKVCRGGFFDEGARRCRSASRHMIRPNERSKGLGLRLVKPSR